MTTAGDGSTSVVLNLPVDPGVNLSTLRHLLAAALPDLDEDACYDLQLVMTELVSNVLDHTPGVGCLRVLRNVTTGEVTVEVDDMSAQQPVHGRSRLGDVRGRGMVVVATIAREWGVRLRSEGGKTVFASVLCTGVGTAAGSATA